MTSERFKLAAIYFINKLFRTSLGAPGPTREDPDQSLTSDIDLLKTIEESLEKTYKNNISRHTADTGSVYLTIKDGDKKIVKIRLSNHKEMFDGCNYYIQTIKNENNKIIFTSKSDNLAYLYSAEEVINIIVDKVNKRTQQSINSEISIVHYSDNTTVSVDEGIKEYLNRIPNDFDFSTAPNIEKDGWKEFRKWYSSHVFDLKYAEQKPTVKSHLCRIFSAKNMSLNEIQKIFVDEVSKRGYNSSGVKAAAARIANQSAKNEKLSIAEKFDAICKKNENVGLSGKFFNGYKELDKIWNNRQYRSSHFDQFLDIFSTMFPWANNLSSAYLDMLRRVVYRKNSGDVEHVTAALLLAYDRKKDTSFFDILNEANNILTRGENVSAYLQEKPSNKDIEILNKIEKLRNETNHAKKQDTTEIVELQVISKPFSEWKNNWAERLNFYDHVEEHLKTDLTVKKYNKLTTKQRNVIKDIMGKPRDYQYLVDTMNNLNTGELTKRLSHLNYTLNTQTKEEATI